MSASYCAICIKCGFLAPGIGGYGFLGVPSLKADPRSWPDAVDLFGDQLPPTFGVLYEPLRKIGLKPFELEVFRAFLEEHESHGLRMTDGDMYQPPDVITLFDELKAKGLERRPYELQESARTEKQRGRASGTVVTGVYWVACRSCGVRHQSGRSLLLPVADHVLAADAIDECVNVWTAAINDLAPISWKAPQPVDRYEPFMAGLPAFLREHQAHGLLAGVEAEPQRGPDPGEYKTASDLLRRLREM